jgi:TonB family protein
MPGIMFQDVACSRADATRKWYTLPLSFLVHTSVLAVLVVVPLIATDVPPRPRAIMEFVTPYVPVVPAAPPPVRRAAPSSATADPSAPVPVGGKIKPPSRIKYVTPGYPDIARLTKVQGIVIIEAVIGTDGTVEQARVLRSQPLLDEAALTAVREWAYTPTLLNGRPTAVIMTVTVPFTLRP